MIGQLKHLRLPDLLTLLGLGSSIAAVFFLSQGREFFLPAYFCILGQLVADFFDGKLARKMKIENSLGVELDNFADFFTIGTTAFFGFTLGIHHPGIYFVFPSFILAAAIRLAYFTKFNAGKVPYFVGLPTTAVSFLIPSILVLNEIFWNIQLNYFLFLYLLCAILMISSLRIRKL